MESPILLNLKEILQTDILKKFMFFLYIHVDAEGNFIYIQEDYSTPPKPTHKDLHTDHISVVKTISNMWVIRKVKHNTKRKNVAF